MNNVSTTPINPWTWQDKYGFSQAIDVANPSRMLFCAGQTSVDGEGNPLHAGDMTAQLVQALDNLETVLAKAGLTLKNVVRLNYYTTNVPAYLQASSAVADRLAKAGCVASGTLLGVAALFHPDIMIELEATAVA
jgi:enamine deaminase RidA (YjgF/YER057c/UK114 family)